MKGNNVNGTSASTCKRGSWLDHWKKFSGQSLPTHCSKKTCTNKPDVGAHVQKDSSYDRACYIVPLCTEHNRQAAKSLDLMDRATLVSANVSQTCG
jgi:hypothetical protein